MRLLARRKGSEDRKLSSGVEDAETDADNDGTVRTAALAGKEGKREDTKSTYSPAQSPLLESHSSRMRRPLPRQVKDQPTRFCNLYFCVTVTQAPVMIANGATVLPSGKGLVSRRSENLTNAIQTHKQNEKSAVPDLMGGNSRAAWK